MSLTRKAVLTVTANPLVNRLVSKYGMKLGASRFVAGENMADTLIKVKELNREGLAVTLDLLGESVTTREEAAHAAQAAVDTFTKISEEGIDSTVSVKLTQLGLDIDMDFCLENMDRITAQAEKTGNFVRIDMENSPRVEATIDIFKQLLNRYRKDHIGLVIQSYLYRSEQDIKELGQQGANLRIVKGAYKEPREVAYPDKQDVDKNFRQLVKMHLNSGAYTAVATHDESIIQWTKEYTEQQKIPRSQFEFQMLFGIRDALQRELAREGYKVRVYTPYGKDWYPYFTRRLAERPANALFVLKSLFRQ